MMFLGSQNKCPQNVLDKLEDAMLKLEKIEEDEMHVEKMLSQRHSDLQLESKLAACTAREVCDEKSVPNSTLDDLASAFGNANTSMGTDEEEPMDEEKLVATASKNTPCGDQDGCACKANQDEKEILTFDSINDNRQMADTTSNQKLLQETQIKIQEIVLDVFNDIQNLINPLISKKFREIFI